MQKYTKIPAEQSLQSSLQLLLDNDVTALSQSSGTAFPTTDLVVGMPCLRTDQMKVYTLKQITPTVLWVETANLNATSWNSVNHGSGSDMNADMVDGIHAATTATAGKLLALDGDAKLPASITGDAATVAGIAPGNATGQIPLSNGTRNVNLNADRVDGYHAGNATAQIPVSNGVVNVDLNADMLDGHHAAAFVRTIGGVAPDANGNVASVSTADRVSKSGDTMTGALNISSGGLNINGGDLTVNSGVTYLNPAKNRYLYWNGTNYVMPGANLLVDGLMVAGKNAINDVAATTSTKTGTGNVVTGVTYALVRANGVARINVNTAYGNCNCNCQCDCGCFPGDTIVRMADGTERAIADVVKGDLVFDADGLATEVLGIWKPQLGDRALYEIDGSVRTTGDHMVMTSRGWAAIDPALYDSRRAGKFVTVDGLGEVALGAKKRPRALTPNMLTVRLNGQPKPIRQIETVEDAAATTQLYTLVTKSGSFVVGDGFIVDGLSQEK